MTITTSSGDYTICVRREKGHCAIGWTPPKYSEDKYGYKEDCLFLIYLYHQGYLFPAPPPPRPPGMAQYSTNKTKLFFPLTNYKRLYNVWSERIVSPRSRGSCQNPSPGTASRTCRNQWVQAWSNYRYIHCKISSCSMRMFANKRMFLGL